MVEKRNHTVGLKHLPGTTAVILDQEFQPAGEVEISMYSPAEKSYRVWWTYKQTGERELIKVPEWKLISK